MLTAFRALPLLWRLISIAVTVAALCGAVGGAYAYVRHQGEVAGYEKAHQECEDDKQKQETANQNAINKAASKLEEIEHQIEIKDGQIDDYQKALDLAADADPNAGLCGLDAGSLHRLNAIS